MSLNVNKNYKTNKMKTVNILTKTAKNILGASMVFALAMATLLPLPTRAADETKPMKPMKGGEHLGMLEKIDTLAQVEALKPDDTFAMVCTKCKTVYVKRVTQALKGAELLGGRGSSGPVGVRTAPAKNLIGTHACAGCNSTMEVTGHGKSKDMVLKHSCKACGDDSAFCCATKPGSPATKGMEKEKK